jgi:hypothetical protein
MWPEQQGGDGGIYRMLAGNIWIQYTVYVQKKYLQKKKYSGNK